MGVITQKYIYTVKVEDDKQGRHSGVKVSTLASRQEDSRFEPASPPGVSVWNLHVLIVAAWGSFMYFMAVCISVLALS